MRRKNFFKLMALVCMVIIVTCVATKPEDYQWTAPGDDGMTGTVAGYLAVMSLDSSLIVACDGGEYTGWLPIPGVQIITVDTSTVFLAAGGTENRSIFTGVDTLPQGTVYFVSLKAYDEAGNYGALGNIVRRVAPDNIAPAAIWDLN